MKTKQEIFEQIERAAITDRALPRVGPKRYVCLLGVMQKIKSDDVFIRPTRVDIEEWEEVMRWLASLRRYRTYADIIWMRAVGCSWEDIARHKRVMCHRNTAQRRFDDGINFIQKSTKNRVKSC